MLPKKSRFNKGKPFIQNGTNRGRFIALIHGVFDLLDVLA
jgi:hypothetical protein